MSSTSSTQHTSDTKQSLTTTTLLHELLYDTIHTTVDNIRYSTKHSTNICYYYNSTISCFTQNCQLQHCCSYCLSPQHNIIHCTETSKLILSIIDKLQSNYYTDTLSQHNINKQSSTTINTNDLSLSPLSLMSSQTPNSTNIPPLPPLTNTTLKQAQHCDICNANVPYGDVNHYNGKKHLKKLNELNLLQNIAQNPIPHIVPVSSTATTETTPPSHDTTSRDVSSTAAHQFDAVSVASRHCQHCSITTDTIEQLVIHLKSNKHMKCIEYLKGLQDIYCELCHTTTHTATEREQHLNSNKHIRAVALSQQHTSTHM